MCGEVPDKQQFFDQYHIQGNGPGSITIGLKHDGIVVAAMTFIRKSNGVFILNRYATSVNVVSGFSKLLAHFKRMYTWSSIETFADLRWSEGKLYQLTGFDVAHMIPPDYQYIINGVPHHKFAFRRDRLASILSEFNPSLSEWENCKLHDIDRIWDCGKTKYVLTNKEST